MNNTSTPLLDAVCRRGVLVSTSVRYWRGCKRLNAEDLGLDPAHVSDRLIQLGHKRLIPRDALQAFALIESRVQATVESSSFPFLGGIGRFVPNPRLGELNDRLEKLRDEFRDATLEFVAGYGPLRETALAEWREAAQHLNGSAERLIATIEQSFPPAGDIAKRFAFETRLFQIAAPDSIRLEVAEGVAQLEAAEDRRRIADDATRRMQADLDAFNREYDWDTPGPAWITGRLGELVVGGDTFVLLGGDAPDGLAVVRLRPNLWSAALEAYLAELYVVPERRGAGLGRALLEATMDEARSHGADRIDLGTSEDDVAARALYERCGFTRHEGPGGPVMYVYEREL